VPQNDKELAANITELKESLTRAWRIACAKEKKNRIKQQEKEKELAEKAKLK